MKVEFPEARIYEETLNCLLYENRTGPDQDLMQVSSRELKKAIFETQQHVNRFTMYAG